MDMSGDAARNGKPSSLQEAGHPFDAVVSGTHFRGAAHGVSQPMPTIAIFRHNDAFKAGAADAVSPINAHQRRDLTAKRLHDFGAETPDEPLRARRDPAGRNERLRPEFAAGPEPDTANGITSGKRQDR
jgi:hypothetical protein